MDNMMLVSEPQREALRHRSREDKWNLVIYQKKTNLQSNSVILSSANLLSHVPLLVCHSLAAKDHSGGSQRNQRRAPIRESHADAGLC